MSTLYNTALDYPATAYAYTEVGYPNVKESVSGKGNTANN